MSGSKQGKDSEAEMRALCTAVCRTAPSDRFYLYSLIIDKYIPIDVPAITGEITDGRYRKLKDRFDAILIVVDKFIKYGHFIPLSHPYKILSVAEVFHNNVYKLHGLPQIIISD